MRFAVGTKVLRDDDDAARCNESEEYFDMLEDTGGGTNLEVPSYLGARPGVGRECIKYKMLAYGRNKGMFSALTKKGMSVCMWVISARSNASALLEPFNIGKGCIRIRKSIDIPKTGLEEFIRSAVALWRKGEDSSC